MILVADGKQSLAIKLKENRQVEDSSESKDYHEVAQSQDDALEGSHSTKSGQKCISIRAGRCLQ